MIIFSKEKLYLLIFFVVPETRKGLKCVSHIKCFCSCIFIFLSTIIENSGCSLKKVIIAHASRFFVQFIFFLARLQQ